MSRRRGQLGNWVGQQLFPLAFPQSFPQDSFVSAGLLPGLRGTGQVLQQRPPEQAGEGGGYLAGRGMDVAQAVPSLRVRVGFFPPAFAP